MNRWDEIKGAALDVAHHVTQDPKQRNAMADDLITLVGLMLNAVGKVTAGEGERDLNSAHDAEASWDDGSYDPTPEEMAEAEAERREEVASAHTRYLMGESIQRAADEVTDEGRTADLERWSDMDRDHGSPGNRYGWHPRCGRCDERGSHTVECDARCGECNRTLQFGHMIHCSRRAPVVDPRCVGCGEEGCNGSCCISI